MVLRNPVFQAAELLLKDVVALIGVKEYNLDLPLLFLHKKLLRQNPGCPFNVGILPEKRFEIFVIGNQQRAIC